MGTGGTLLPSSPEWFQAVAGLRLCCLKLIALSCSHLLALASLVLARGGCTCFRLCCLRVALALLAFALRFALAFARAALPLVLAFACTCCFGSLRLPSLSLRLPLLAPLPRFRFGPLFALFSDRSALPASSYAPSKLHSEKLTSKTSFSFRSSLRFPASFRLHLFSFFSLKSSVFTFPLLLICSEPSCRPISIGKLQHCCSYTADLSPLRLRGVSHIAAWNLLLEVGFTLRCLQRLSPPHFASQLCRWHDNCCTRDASTPVLSYWEQLLS